MTVLNTMVKYTQLLTKRRKNTHNNKFY